MPAQDLDSADDNQFRPASLLVLLLWLLAAWPPVAIAQTATSSAGTSPSPPAAVAELRILTWPDYFNSEVIETFQRRYGARIQESHFTQDADRTERLLETGGKGYDLILVSGSDLHVYGRRGWLAALDAKRLPNLNHISPHWRDAHVGAQTYGVPYFWGTMGILYRKDRVSEPLLSWNQLLSPSADLQGKIGMIDDPRDLFGIALKSMGHSLNSEDPLLIRKAGERLRSQRPHVGSYSYTSLGRQAHLIGGDLVAAVAYNGDAQLLQALDPNLEFVIPLEGSNLWVDYFCLSAKSEHTDLAYEFLNFIHEPKIAAQLAQSLFYATPNQSAELLLPREFLDNPAVYPDTQTLEASEFYRPLSPRALRLRNEIFLSLTE